MKFGILALASLLLSAPTFAAPTGASVPAPKPQAAYSYDTKSFAPASQTFLVIEVDGEVFMKLRMANQPKNRHFVGESPTGVVYDAQTGVTTLKSPASIIASQGDKTLWNLSFPNSVVTLKQLVVPNFTVSTWPLKDSLRLPAVPTAPTTSAGG